MDIYIIYYAYTYTLCTLLSVIISSVPGWNENVNFSMTHVHIVHVDSTCKFAGTHMSLIRVPKYHM